MADAGSAAVATLARLRRRRSARVRTLVWPVGAVALLLMLNLLGVVRIPGGPLAEPGESWLGDVYPHGSVSAAIASFESGFIAGQPFYAGIPVQNSGPLPVSVDSVEPGQLSRGLRVEAVSALPGLGPMITLDRAAQAPGDRSLFIPVTGAAIGTDYAHRDLRVVLELRAETPGQYWLKYFIVNYRVGPFAFRTVYHMGYIACLGPKPAYQTCPDVFSQQAEGGFP